MDLDKKAPKGVLVLRTSGTKVEHHLEYESKGTFCETRFFLGQPVGLFGFSSGKTCIDAGTHEPDTGQETSLLLQKFRLWCSDCKVDERLSTPTCETPLPFSFMTTLGLETLLVSWGTWVSSSDSDFLVHLHRRPSLVVALEALAWRHEVRSSW